MEGKFRVRIDKGHHQCVRSPPPGLLCGVSPIFYSSKSRSIFRVCYVLVYPSSSSSSTRDTQSLSFHLYIRPTIYIHRFPHRRARASSCRRRVPVTITTEHGDDRETQPQWRRRSCSCCPLWRCCCSSSCPPPPPSAPPTGRRSGDTSKSARVSNHIHICIDHLLACCSLVDSSIMVVWTAEAHMFWWLYRSPHRVDNGTTPWPTVLWLQGGPVSS